MGSSDALSDGCVRTSHAGAGGLMCLLHTIVLTATQYRSHRVGYLHMLVRVGMGTRRTSWDNVSKAQLLGALASDVICC